MPRLRDRTKSIPYGFKWIQPQTKWEPYPHSSFKTVVDGLVQHRRANPALGQKYGWKTAWNEVADEVDLANALNMQRLGHTAYIIEDSNPVTAVPKAKARPQPSRSVKNAAAAIDTIADMFGAQGPIRDIVHATHRAAVCVACPKHEKGDWTRFFTVPAQFAIRKVLGLVKDLDLSTKYDDQLQVCGVCQCPMKAKVWTRIEHITAHIPAEDKANLDPECWILNEEKPS
jgi:hypothetical protein